MQMLTVCVTALVPTRVGMILVLEENYAENFACPHTRGDDP